MAKRSITFLFLLISLLFSTITVSAEAIGEIITTDGQQFYLSQFGSKENQKKYYVKTEKRFTPFEEIKHITRIDIKPGRFLYLIVLLNGEYESGRQGLLFYENVSYINPTSGQQKNAFVPVIKDRQQSGLIFTAMTKNKKPGEIIEISYPDNIDRISMGMEAQEFRKNKVKKKETTIYQYMRASK